MSYNFEIFHMREKQIPVDSVEIKEPIHAFAWEPVGSKFAIIHGEIPSVNVSFYEVRYGHQPALLSKWMYNRISIITLFIWLNKKFACLYFINLSSIFINHTFNVLPDREIREESL